MEPPSGVSRLWLLLPLLLTVAPPLTPAVGRTDPAAPPLAADLKLRLENAARDPWLDAWQRDFMNQVARGSQPSQIHRSTSALTTSSVPGIDGTWHRVPPPTPRPHHS